MSDAVTVVVCKKGNTFEFSEHDSQPPGNKATGLIRLRCQWNL